MQLLQKKLNVFITSIDMVESINFGHFSFRRYDFSRFIKDNKCMVLCYEIIMKKL